MRPEEQYSSKNSETRRRGVNFDLYYYQLTEEGYSLRITPLGLVLMLIALVIGFAILYSFAPSREKPNINIRTPQSSTESSTYSITNSTLPPPSTLLRVPKRSAATVTDPAASHRARRSTNGQ